MNLLPKPSSHFTSLQSQLSRFFLTTQSTDARVAYKLGQSSDKTPGKKNKPERGPGKKKRSAVIHLCCCATGGTSSPRSTSYLLTQPWGQPWMTNGRNISNRHWQREMASTAVCQHTLSISQKCSLTSKSSPITFSTLRSWTTWLSVPDGADHPPIQMKETLKAKTETHEKLKCPLRLRDYSCHCRTRSHIWNQNADPLLSACLSALNAADTAESNYNIL